MINKKEFKQQYQEYSEHVNDIVNATTKSFGEDISGIAFAIVCRYIIPPLLNQAILTGRVGPSPEYIHFALARRLHEDAVVGENPESIVERAATIIEDEEAFLSMMFEAQELSKVTSHLE